MICDVVEISCCKYGVNLVLSFCYKRNEIKYARRLHFNNSFKSFQIIGTLWITNLYGQPGCGYKKTMMSLQWCKQENV